MHEVPRIRRFSFEGESIEADEVESLTDGAEVGFRQRPWWPIRGSIIGGRQPPDAHEVAIRCDQLWQHLGSSVTRSLRDGLEDVDFEDEVEGPDPFLRWLQKVGNNPFDVSIPCKGCCPRHCSGGQIEGSHTPTAIRQCDRILAESASDDERTPGELRSIEPWDQGGMRSSSGPRNECVIS